MQGILVPEIQESSAFLRILSRTHHDNRDYEGCREYETDDSSGPAKSNLGLKLGPDNGINNPTYVKSVQP